MDFLIDADTTREIHAMHRNGATPTEIANVLNISPRSAGRHIQRRIEEDTETTVVYRHVANCGYSRAPRSVTYVSLPRVRFLEAANDNVPVAATQVA